MSFNVTTKLATLSSGVQLHTERITSSNSPAESSTSTIILIHGLTSSVNAWYPIYGSLVSALPATSLLAYDWSGTGCSPIHPSRRNNQLTFTQLVGDLDALIAQEVPAGPITILAHSAGTLQATQFLLSSSPAISRITHVVLIGGPLETPIAPEIVTMQMEMAALVEKQGSTSIVDSRMGYTTGPTTVKSRPVAVALMRAISVMESREGAAAAIRAFSRYCQSAAVLEKIPHSVKVLIIGGDEDLWFSRDTLEKVSRRIHGSEVIMMEKVGHIPQVETPDECAQVITTFLKSG